jgi:hypothetical protein
VLVGALRVLERLPRVVARRLEVLHRLGGRVVARLPHVGRRGLEIGDLGVRVRHALRERVDLRLEILARVVGQRQLRCERGDHLALRRDHRLLGAQPDQPDVAALIERVRRVLERARLVARVVVALDVLVHFLAQILLLRDDLVRGLVGRAIVAMTARGEAEGEHQHGELLHLGSPCATGLPRRSPTTTSAA